MQLVHEEFMSAALAEARRALGRTSPNPQVGAVVVRDGQVIASGYHKAAGQAHGETEALHQAGDRARGADLYITLEPCNHHGKTPPCTEAILRAGIARVFVGSVDPNPVVSGRGIARLREAGIPVEVGVLGAETDRLIEGWSHFIRSRRPWVIAKVASTLDGRIATRSGDSRWITSESTRARVHRLRDEVDAILVGRGTVEADDPQLTTRLPDGSGRDPLRVILDSSLRVSTDARIFRVSSAAKTLIACVGPADPMRAAPLREVGAEILECEGRDGRVDPASLLEKLGAMNVVQLLVEGGAQTLGAFLEARLVDRLLLHYGPLVFGEGPTWTRAPAAEKVVDALRLRLASAELVDGDLLVDARLG